MNLRTGIRVFVSLSGLFLFFMSTANASDYGTLGLISTPTARQPADGVFVATLATNEVANHFNLTFQATPWLETTFRYSYLNPYKRYEAAAIGSDIPVADRSYGAKLRLIKEGDRIPEVAVGIRDLLGTGVWSSEYFVASKRKGAVDFSLGIGWGRLAQRDQLRNPLGLVSTDFETRPTQRETGGAYGGQLRAGNFFRGPIGIFGGLRYNFFEGFALALERNPDGYLKERRLNSKSETSSLGVALEWSPLPFLSTALSFQQGDFVGLNIRVSGDFKQPSERKHAKLESSLDDRGAKFAPSFLNLNSWYDTLLFDAERSGLRIYSASFVPGSDDVELVVANDSYTQWGDAINQTLTLAELHLPDKFRRVRLHLIEDEFPAATIDYLRESSMGLELGVVPGLQELALERVSIVSPAKPNRPRNITDFGFPRLALGADFANRVQLMDPNHPLKYQIYLKATARLAFSRMINVWSSYSVDVSNNFDTVRPSDSVLPRVRSEINRYLTEGSNGVDSLFLEFKDVVRPDVYGRAYFGLLEEMFGGAGAEVLWSPFSSRIALGVNLSWVAQRQFQKNFDFQKYQTFTGHVSAYYASPIYDLDFGLHVGRYLAGDEGYTFEARRTFDNGFSLGAFFTKTNVSTEDFGEGSFDKGLFLSIPLNALLPMNTRSRYRTIVRPIERDGGRRLEGFVGELWWNRRAVRADALNRQEPAMIPQ